jgi:hypothetical protein
MPRDGIILTPEPPPGAGDAARVAVSGYSSTNIPTRPGEVRQGVDRLAETTQRAFDDVENDRQKVERAVNANTDAINQHADLIELNRDDNTDNKNHSAQVFRTLTQGVPALATTRILFNSTIDDSLNFVPGASDQFVVPQSTWYNIRAEIFYTLNLNADWDVLALLNVGGSAFSEDYHLNRQAWAPTILSRRKMILNTGPTFIGSGTIVSVDVYHDKAGGLNFEAGCEMFIERVRSNP